MRYGEWLFQPNAPEISRSIWFLVEQMAPRRDGTRRGKVADELAQID